MLLDVTAVDYLSERASRYDVVYHMLSLSNKHRLRLKVPVPGEDPTIDTRHRHLERRRLGRARGLSTCSASSSKAIRICGAF